MYASRSPAPVLATAAAVRSATRSGRDRSARLDNRLHVGTQDALRKMVQVAETCSRQFRFAPPGRRSRPGERRTARLLVAPGLVGRYRMPSSCPKIARRSGRAVRQLGNRRTPSAGCTLGLESLKCGWRRQVSPGTRYRQAGTVAGALGNCSLRTSNASACAAPVAGGQR